MGKSPEADRPLHGYGAHAPETTRGSSHVRFLLGNQVLRLTTNAPIDFVLSETTFVADRPYAFVLGPDGRQEFIVYHAWPPDMSARLMRIDRLVWHDGQPVIEGPTWTPQTMRLPGE